MDSSGGPRVGRSRLPAAVERGAQHVAHLASAEKCLHEPGTATVTSPVRRRPSDALTTTRGHRSMQMPAQVRAPPRTTAERRNTAEPAEADLGVPAEPTGDRKRAPAVRAESQGDQAPAQGQPVTAAGTIARPSQPCGGRRQSGGRSRRPRRPGPAWQRPQPRSAGTQGSAADRATQPRTGTPPRFAIFASASTSPKHLINNYLQG